MADFITISATSREALTTIYIQYQMKGYEAVGDVYEQTEGGVITYFQQLRKD